MNKLGCPNNWLRAGHKCYKFNTGASHTWQESSDACRRTNSRLLQITTKDQKVNQTMIFINSYFQQRFCWMSILSNNLLITKEVFLYLWLFRKKSFFGVFFLFTCMTTLIKHYRTGFSTLQWSSVPSLSGLVSIFILVTKLGTGQTKRKLVWIWCKKRDIVYFILWWSNIFIEASKYWYCNVLIFSNNFLIAGVGMLNLMISMDRKTVVSYFRTALLMIFPASNLSHISVNSSQKVIIHENQCI